MKPAPHTFSEALMVALRALRQAKLETVELSNAYHAGGMAWLNGVQWQNCPYLKGSDEAAAWLVGYDAEKEANS